jgi:hypothetical protein
MKAGKPLILCQGLRKSQCVLVIVGRPPQKQGHACGQIKEQKFRYLGTPVVVSSKS